MPARRSTSSRRPSASASRPTSSAGSSGATRPSAARSRTRSDDDAPGESAVDDVDVAAARLLGDEAIDDGTAARASDARRAELVQRHVDRRAGAPPDAGTRDLAADEVAKPGEPVRAEEVDDRPG